MAPALISCDGNMATRLIFSTFLVRCNGVFSSSGRLHIKYRYKHKMFHLSPFMQLSNNRSISLKFERETQVKDVKKKSNYCNYLNIFLLHAALYCTLFCDAFITRGTPENGKVNLSTGIRKGNNSLFLPAYAH